MDATVFRRLFAESEIKSGLVEERYFRDSSRWDKMRDLYEGGEQNSSAHHQFSEQRIPPQHIVPDRASLVAPGERELRTANI